MTIMSKSSQQAPARKPDPLFQYPERYSQEDGEHQDRYRRLTAAGHKVWMWKNDPVALRDYEKATAGNKPETEEQKHKRLADTKKDIEYERDHGEMRPREPEQYDESGQTKPPKPKDDPPEEESEELREMRRLGGQRDASPWGRNSPQPAMPLRGGVR